MLESKILMLLDLQFRTTILAYPYQWEDSEEDSDQVDPPEYASGPE